MAWYKYRKWRNSFNKRNPAPNLIYWYKEYVLKSSEQRERERIEGEIRGRNALMNLLTISTICRQYGGSFYDKL